MSLNCKIPSEVTSYDTDAQDMQKSCGFHFIVGVLKGIVHPKI